MSTSDRIRILLIKCGKITASELARRMGISSQALNSKMRRDDFKESELKAIAEALNCEYTMTFVIRETGEAV